MGNNSIIVERTYNATIEKVWNAISNKEEMKKWYFDLAEFKAEVGFKFQFTGGPPDGVQYLHLCEITEVIPEKKLTYSWKYDGYEGISFVTFELTPIGNTTKLVLTHSGVDSFPKSNKDFGKHNFVEGWTQIIGMALPEYLNK
ncbi:MAG: SRPBCC domain-containing protein [Bacteroidota bacterium]|nr:SRPBCC domain-containing protein [Bacteroidota bacterium]